MRRGDDKALTRFIRLRDASIASTFIVYNACLGGAHTAGALTGGAFAVRCEVNRFAKLIEPDFPTLAELLIAAQNGETMVERPNAANY